MGQAQPVQHIVWRVAIIDPSTHEIIEDGPETEGVLLICQVDVSEDLFEIEALSTMAERKAKLKERFDRAREPIATFVREFGGTEITSSLGWGTLAFNATRSNWRRMLAIEDSPLRVKAVSILPNLSVTLDAAQGQALGDD